MKNKLFIIYLLLFILFISGCESLWTEDEKEDCVFLMAHLSPDELVFNHARRSLIDVEIYKNDQLDSSYYLGRIDSSYQSTIDGDVGFQNSVFWNERTSYWQYWATQRVSVELQLYPDSTFDLNYYHHLTEYEIYQRWLHGDLNINVMGGHLIWHPEETRVNQFPDSSHYGDFMRLSTFDYMLIHSGGKKQTLRFVYGGLLEVREEFQYEVDETIYSKFLIADDFEVETYKPDTCY
jgi:hypothetical protein